MGLFDKLKQMGQAAEQAAASFQNVQISITIPQPKAKIGDTLQGSFNITTSQPYAIKQFNISVGRLLKPELVETGGERDAWKLAEQTLPAGFTLQPGETKTIPFSITVGDGLNIIQADNDKFLSQNFSIVGVNPAALPKGSLMDYMHEVTVIAIIDDQMFTGIGAGPVGVMEVEIEYPSVNLGSITITG